MSGARFQAEVLPYLQPAELGARWLREWETVRLVVGTTVERWLVAAAQRDDADVFKDPSGTGRVRP